MFFNIRKYWDKIILSIFISIYTVVLGTLSILRHNAFASNFDLSNMDHTVWNTLYGNFFSLRYHDDYVSRLSVHADFILILLSPFYLIWNDVRMLLLLQSVFLAVGAIPIFLLAQKIIKIKFVSLTLVIVYLLNPAMMWTNIYDFHPISLVVPFFLFAFYFAFIKKWFWYWVFVILAILTKENQSLNIAMLGLFIAFIFNNKRVGLITFIGGVMWFVLMVFVVIPKFSPNSMHWALQEFEGQALPNPLVKNLNPLVFIDTFFVNKENISYYDLLFKQFAYLPLLGFPWMLLSFPSIVINILRDTKTINFHYSTGVIPALSISSVFGVSYLMFIIKNIKALKPYSKYITVLICVLIILVTQRVNYNYSPLPTTPSCWCQIYNVTQEDKDFENALMKIPKDASITASLEVRPHINHRLNVWFVPSATQSAQYIALIRQNRIVGNYEPKDYENRLIPILLSSNNHKVVFESKNFYLFEKINYEPVK